MSIYEAAEARDSLEQALKDLQWLVIETLIRRKEVLDIDDVLHLIYRQRGLAKRRLRKLVG
jgi:hypothetical protein